MNSFEKLVVAVDAVRADAQKCLVGGNKAAGVRLRKAMMEVRELAKAVKAESLEV